jgi:hypothetical protein
MSFDYAFAAIDAAAKAFIGDAWTLGTNVAKWVVVGVLLYKVSKRLMTGKW